MDKHLGFTRADTDMHLDADATIEAAHTIAMGAGAEGKLSLRGGEGRGEGRAALEAKTKLVLCRAYEAVELFISLDQSLEVRWG